MSTFKSVCYATVAAAALCSPAMAQDWAGFYGGLSVGYGLGDATHSYSNLAPTDNSNPEGALIGGFVGYGVQSGNTVWGGEIDLEFSDYSGSFVNTTGATSQGSIDGNWQGSVRGVLGLASTFAGKPALYYATGGWAVGECGTLAPTFPFVTMPVDVTQHAVRFGLRMEF